MDTSLDITRPAPWVETAEVLGKIIYCEDFVVAQMGPRINLVLPKEVGRMLDAYVGHRLSLLRTDLPDKPYLAIEIDARGNMMGSIIPSKHISVGLSKIKAISQDFSLQHGESVRVAYRETIFCRLDRSFRNFGNLEMDITQFLINGFAPKEVMS